ncbi:hypothetical protein JOF38_002023 [Paenarthrobacter nicotinovorans]|nr:hypothetical protein [Paenarthrobacter nicotinovorans]MBP2394778.1 hypothetical protein [Paenarthrobacter nicotinovorans]
MPRPSLNDGRDALLLAQTALGSYLDDASEALVELGSSVAADTRLFGFGEAADFAGRVEDLSRQLEYVQVVAAQAVERTRTEAQRAVPAQQPGQSPASGAQEWRTGWTEPAGESEGGGRR